MSETQLLSLKKHTKKADTPLSAIHHLPPKVYKNIFVSHEEAKLCYRNLAFTRIYNSDRKK